MSLTARFDGGQLPDGWTQTAPAGTSVDLDGQLVLHIDGGVACDSIFNTSSNPEGPRVEHALDGGDLDVAVQLGEEICNLTRAGLDLIVLGEGTDAVRYGLYCQSATPLGTLTYAYARSATSGNGSESIAPTAPWNNGHGGWLRLSYTSGEWVMWISSSGRSGDWSEMARFASTMAPQSLMLHAVTTNASQSEGRDQRIVRTVDLLDLGSDDATDPVPETVRSTVLNANLGGSSLPAGLTGETANGGTLSVADGVATLTTDMSTDGSYAWLLVDDEPPTDHGLLVQLRRVAGASENAYYAACIRMDDARGAPGFLTPDDQYGYGVGYLFEGATNNSGRRFIRRNPVQAGGDFEEPYTFLVTDTDGVTPSSWQWLRIEVIGGRVRCRQWADGDGEPSTWDYDVEDAMRPSGKVAFTLSHNDGTTGASASIEIAALQVYQLVTETVDPNAVTLSVIDDQGAEQPVTAHVLHNDIERPVEVCAVGGA